MTAPPAVARGRLSWMDLLRGGAIFCVIVLHAVELSVMLSGIQTPDVLNDFNAAVASYRMPLLFVLSGMLLSRALAKTTAVYYAGKIRNLLWPYLVWVNVYWLVTMPTEFPPWHEWIATSWLWYLFYLLIYFVAAPLISRVPSWLVASVCFAVSVVVPEGRWTDFFLFAGYFFVGDVVWRQRRSLHGLSGPAWTVVGAIVVIGLSAAYVAQRNGSEFVLPLRREQLVYVPLTILAIGGLVLLARRVPDAWSRALRYLGRNSIVFYLVHFPAQILVTRLLTSLDEWRWQAHVGAGIVVAIGVGVALTALRRFVVFDALFTLPRLGALRARA